ncbi:MAG: hypothetical protein ABWX73_11550 [Marmoricola sp.]
MRVPCSTQVAVQERGITCTTIRRRHCVQNRGGSILSRAWQSS